jgi:hypothetical protein
MDLRITSMLIQACADLLKLLTNENATQRLTGQRVWFFDDEFRVIIEHSRYTYSI